MKKLAFSAALTAACMPFMVYVSNLLYNKNIRWYLEILIILLVSIVPIYASIYGIKVSVKHKYGGWAAGLTALLALYVILMLWIILSILLFRNLRYYTWQYTF